MSLLDDIYKAFEQSAGVCTDTRAIFDGCFFVALKGDKFDANVFVDSALSMGAAYVLSSDAKYLGNSKVFVVPDTLKALQMLALERRKRLSIPVVGITGTNGKTTTKELVSTVLARKFKVAATKGNLNNQIGVPLTVLSIPSDAEIAVVEMGASHPGDIRELVQIARPTAGLISNVGRAHLQGFGSFDGVKSTKGELYDYLQWHQPQATVFIDCTNPDLVDMANLRIMPVWANVMPYGNSREQNLMPVSPCASGRVDVHSELLQVVCECPDGDVVVSSQMTGEYNLPNVLAAVAVGRYFGVPDSEIFDAIAKYSPSNSRSQIVQTQRNRVILDAYNANPSSMDAALANFANAEQPRKGVILGAMRELGADEEAEHKSVLDRLSTMNLESVMLVGHEFKRFEAQYPMFRFYAETPDVAGDLATLSGLYLLVKGSNSNKLGSLMDKL